MAAAPLVLPLGRIDVVVRALWGALYGFALGLAIATAGAIAVGASPESGVLFRLVGPLGMLAGAVITKVRAPAMGVIVDSDGIELHGLVRTRRLPWARIDAVGWANPGRRFAVRLDSGATRSGDIRLPRRLPAELVRLATAHGVPVVTDRNLRAAPHPLVDVRPPA